MATYDLGKVSMTLGGAYNATTTYSKLTMVIGNDGRGYITIVDNVTGISPGATAGWEAYWQMISNRGSGITSIALTSTSGLIDTYTITYENGLTSTYQITNGNGIASITQTGAAGLVKTYTITYTNGNTTTFSVADGAAATVQAGTTATSAAGTQASVSNSGTTSAAVFNFTIPKGDKGDPGDVSSVNVKLPDSAGNVTLYGEDVALSASDSKKIPDAISEKANKASNPTSGNFASLDASGNLTDSGKKAADFAVTARGLPSGGTTGQTLSKKSGTDYAAEWKTLVAGDVGAYTKGETNSVVMGAVGGNDALFLSMLDGTPANYKMVMRAWFNANGSAVVTDLTTLVERWYTLTRTGWTGGTQFWQPDQSTLSTGTKTGSNAGLSCTPSTNTAAGADSYAGLPLFAVTDCNWTLDANGVKQITAIDGINGGNAFIRTTASAPVGVLQMAPWVKYDTTSTTYAFTITDQTGASGYAPVPEAIDLDGTVHSWVLHSKYGMGDAYSSISGVPIRVWDVSYTSQLTAIPAAWSANKRYCGRTSSDDAWMKLMVYIKYGSLTLDGIMNGCFDYYRDNIQPAVAETGVKRVLVTTAQGAGLLVGSTVCLGTAAYDSKANQCSVVDRARIASITSVTVSGTTYAAVNLDVSATFDTTTALYLSTMQWYAGSCDNVLGNDGSPYSNTSTKEPYKLQGIEQAYGCLEAAGDTILQYSGDGTTNYMTGWVCKDATKLATSVTTDYKAAAYSVACPSSDSWQYIKRLGYDATLPELWIPTLTGGSSSTYTRDATYLKAVSSGVYEWLALGALYDGLTYAGLSCMHANTGLGNAWWDVGGRLSANGSRGSTIIGFAPTAATLNNFGVTSTPTELSYMQGVTAPVQQQIGAVQTSISDVQTTVSGKAAKSEGMAATLTAAGWSGTAAPYTQEVAVSGMTASLNGLVGLAMSATAAQVTEAVAAQLMATAQGDGTVTFSAFKAKPTADIPVNIVKLG